MEDQPTYGEEKKANNRFLVELELFQSKLNAEPAKDEIKIKEFANKSKYLPISFVQMKLDELFYGLWQTVNFTARPVVNEMVGELQLMVYHPVLKEWLSRTGAAATPIQLRVEYEKNDDGTDKMVNNKKVKKQKDILDVGSKIENTLVKDYPHLYAECIKSAAKTLGKIFGRDLNRKEVDTYNPIMIAQVLIPENNETINELLFHPLLDAADVKRIQSSMDKIKGNHIAQDKAIAFLTDRIKAAEESANKMIGSGK